MEPTQNHESKKEIKLNLDDFDLDNFEIRPINKGLGFHKSEERSRFSSSRVSPKVESKPKLRGPSAPIHPSNTISDSVPMPRVLQQEQKKDIEVAEINKPIEQQEQINKAADNFKRLGAYLIDVSILVVIFSLLVGIFLLIAGQSLQMNSLLTFFSNSDLLIASGLFFCLLYLLYFSILDMQSSFGKDLFSIKVMSTYRDNLSITDSFVRTLFSLVSFLALGLPMLLDFHSRLSDTKVVEK